MIDEQINIYIVTPGEDRPRHCRRISTILYCKYTFLLITKYNKYICTGQKSYNDSHFKYCRSLTKRLVDQYIDFRGSIFSRCTNFMSA